jgi:hypothetical protein
MTERDKADVLAKMLDIPDEDIDYGLLTVFLRLAGQKILNRMYPYKESYDGLTVPDRYLNVQLKIASYMINKMGAEGEIQHIENGIHRNYGDADIPESLLKDVAPFCQAVR